MPSVIFPIFQYRDHWSLWEFSSFAEIFKCCYSLCFSLLCWPLNVGKGPGLLIMLTWIYFRIQRLAHVVCKDQAIYRQPIPDEPHSTITPLINITVEYQFNSLRKRHYDLFELTIKNSMRKVEFKQSSHSFFLSLSFLLWSLKSLRQRQNAVFI